MFLIKFFIKDSEIKLSWHKMVGFLLRGQEKLSRFYHVDKNMEVGYQYSLAKLCPEYS